MNTRVYVVDTTQEVDNENYVSDIALFMYEAEKQGTVFTLDGFNNAFNGGEINSNTDLIEIVTK